MQKKFPGIFFGSEDKVRIGDNLYGVKYAVMEVDQLPPASQGAGSFEISQDPRWEMLNASETSDMGAPVLDGNGNLVDGINRRQGIEDSYHLGRSGGYLEQLRANAGKYGILPSVVDALRRPALVRFLSKPLGKVQETTTQEGASQVAPAEVQATPAAQEAISPEQWTALPAGAETMLTEKVKQNSKLLHEAKQLWIGRTSVGQGLKSLLDMLTTETNRTTKEHAFALSFTGDPKGSLWDFFTTNNKGEVRISQNTPLVRLLRDSNQSILFVHSHPNNTSFSPGDIESFNNSPGEKISVVRGNKGFVAFMVKPNSLWDKRYVSLSEKATRAANKLAKDLTYRNLAVMQALKEGKLTKDQLFLAYTRLISLGVARLGLIRYTDTAPLSDLDFIPNWRKNLETITKIAAGKEIQNSIFMGVKEAYADGPRYLDEHNRLARSIGEPGGIEKLLQGPANVAGGAAQAQRPGGVSRATPAPTRNEPSGAQAALTSGAQEITSAGTSLNQVPALFKSAVFSPAPGSRNLDIGGERYDMGTKYLKDERKVDSAVYDPYNRSAEHNDQVLRDYEANPADTVTVANVLNVIKEKGARQDTIGKANQYLRPGGVAYFSIYEGDKSGKGRETSKGFQHNKRAQDFLAEVREVFPGAFRSGNVIVAPKEAQPALITPPKAPEGVTKDAENFLKGSAEASQMLDETSIPFSCRVRR